MTPTSTGRPAADCPAHLLRPLRFVLPRSRWSLPTAAVLLVAAFVWLAAGAILRVGPSLVDTAAACSGSTDTMFFKGYNPLTGSPAYHDRWSYFPAPDLWPRTVIGDPTALTSDRIHQSTTAGSERAPLGSTEGGCPHGDHRDRHWLTSGSAADV